MYNPATKKYGDHHHHLHQNQPPTFRGQQNLELQNNDEKIDINFSLLINNTKQGQKLYIQREDGKSDDIFGGPGINLGFLTQPVNLNILNMNMVLRKYNKKHNTNYKLTDESKDILKDYIVELQTRHEDLLNYIHGLGDPNIVFGKKNKKKSNKNPNKAKRTKNNRKKKTKKS